MTAETRTTITLTDLNAIEFECTACHTRVFIPLSDEVFVPSECPSPNCENKNWYTIGSQEHRDLKALIDMIRRHRQSHPKYLLRFGSENLAFYPVTA